MNLRSRWLSIWTLWEKFWSAGDRKRSLYISYEHCGIFHVDKWHINRLFKATFPCKISIIFRYGAFRNTFLSRKSNFSCRILPIAHMNWKISVRPVYSDSWISFSDCYFQHHFEHYFSSDSSGRKSILKHAATDHSVGVVLGWFFHKCVRSCVCFDTQYVHPPNAFCQVKKTKTNTQSYLDDSFGQKSSQHFTLQLESQIFHEDRTRCVRAALVSFKIICFQKFGFDFLSIRIRLYEIVISSRNSKTVRNKIVVILWKCAFLSKKQSTHQC